MPAIVRTRKILSMGPGIKPGWYAPATGGAGGMPPAGVSAQLHSSLSSIHALSASSKPWKATYNLRADHVEGGVWLQIGAGLIGSAAGGRGHVTSLAPRR